ncbi:MAG: phosphoribosylformylglycinamidine synthase subunit PurQ [Alphaproteobacteria bacterium GM7ARS4]|nr:phosphoribosylformylglycinamidine synthase subunit PurQ [Alphaproteobacteria bacterium GM7ARS4]
MPESAPPKRAVVIVFPASNCDKEIGHALEHILAWDVCFCPSHESTLPDASLYVVPGGFSWGDYLRTGALAARTPAIQALKKRNEQGCPILAICNGFQILTEAGMLPGVLQTNHALTFICAPQTLRVDSTHSLWTQAFPQGTCLSFPIAHHAGCYTADDATLDALEKKHRVILRYVDETGETHQDANPNGSCRAIAGLTNEQGNICALMPHPERALYPWHGSTDGARFLSGFHQSLLKTATSP